MKSKITSQFVSFPLVFKTWLDRNKKFNNSMMTTTDVCFTEGQAQLKWWKMRGQVIVKTVSLDSEYRGKGFFTQACKKLLSEQNDVDCIQLESVLEDELMEKLQLMGWRKQPYGNNLFLERHKIN